MRVFIGLAEVAGYFGNLQQGFEELGIECTFFHFGHPFLYKDSIGATDSQLVRILRFVSQKRVSTPRSQLLLKVWWKGLQNILLPLMFVEALFRFDAFIFSYATSFFGHYIDLPILKFLKKRVIYVFLGSDSRPPYINGALMSCNSVVTIEQCINLTRDQKRRLKTIEQYADVVVCHHLSAQLHERHFIPLVLLGFPCLPSTLQLSAAETLVRRSVRILHSPSKPKAKGTAEIRRAIDNLKAKGNNIEFVEITGRPHAVVLDELANCDFVVDELYSDARMAGLATEAASFGKPTVVGGYANDRYMAIEGAFSVEQFPPVYYCHPDDIETAIEKLIVDEKFRNELGNRARQFVSGQWSLKQVAERYLWLLEGNIPAQWMFDPGQIRYVFGFGLSEARVKEIVRSVIKKGGPQSLQLSDKAELKRAFLSLGEETLHG